MVVCLLITTFSFAILYKELLTLPEHLSSPPVFSGVRVTRSIVLCVWFVDLCLSFCPFSVNHCTVYPSYAYELAPFGHCVFCFSSIADSDYPFYIFKLFLCIMISLFVSMLKS